MFLVMRQCCPTSAAGFSILFGIAGFCAKRVYATRITEMSAPIPVRGLGAVPEVTQRPAPLDNVEEVCKDDADVALGCRRLGGNAETVEEDALLDTISRIEYAIRNKVTGGFSMKDVTQTEFQLDTLVGTEVLTAYVQEENRTSPPGSDWDIDRHAGVAVLLRGADLDPTEWVTTGLPQFAQSEGKYYIEVILHRGFADAQIGYATSDFKQHRGQDFLNTDHELYGLGVGDDSESWSVDGARQMIFQDGGEREWDGSWSQDGETTVVGCSLDFDSGEAWFSINGKWTQRAAFTIPAGKAVYPAITLFGRATYTTNDFRYRRCTGCVPWVAHVVSYNSWDYNRHLQDQRLTIPSKWSKTQFRSSELVRARVEDVLGFDAIVSFGDAVHQIPMSWIRARVTPGTVLLAWLSVADARLCPVVVQAASSGTVSGFMIVKMHGECFKNLGKGFGKGVAKQARDAMGRGRGGEPALELNASSYTISTSQVLAELYPAIGETLQWRVRTPMGSGVVTGFDVASRLVTIQLIRRGIKGGKISVAVSKIVGEGPAPSTVQCQALCKQLSRRLGVGIRASQVQQDGNVPLEVQPGIRNTVRLQEGDVTMALPAARYRFALQENDIATSLLNITAPTTNFSHTHGLLEGDLFYAGEPSVLGTSSGKGFGVHHIKTGKGVGKKELPPETFEQLEKARWALMGFFGVMPSATEVDASTLAFVPPEYVASINRLDEEILQARQWVLVAMTRMADYRNWGAGEIVKNTLELFFGSSDPAVADSVYEILEAVYVSLVNIVIRHEPVTVQHVNWDLRLQHS